MKKILSITLLFLLLGCDKPGDCVKSSGPMATKIYDDLSFTKILVNKGIAVVIRQGAVCRVEVQAGENLINDIEVSVDAPSGLLTLRDDTTCNWTREYGQTVVYVTTPELTDVYSKTEKSISSDGILTFTSLRLASMDGLDGYAGVGTGDFIMSLQTGQLTIDSNQVSRYYLAGTAAELHVNFYESGGIFHGESLKGQKISVFHRGTNDIFVNPSESLRGDIYNIGNVFSLTHPAVVEIVEHYSGKLIFY